MPPDTSTLAPVPGLIAALVLALVLALAAVALLAAALRRARRAAADEAEEGAHDGLWHRAEAEERSRALIEATTDVIVQRDGEGRITYADAGFADLVGRPPAALLGTRADLSVLEQGASSVGPGGVRRTEALVRAEDGRTRWFAFVEVPVTRGAGPVEWLRAGRDVTARVEALRSLDGALGRAEAASGAKSRFLATVSHEMRTPLNGILGMADLVLGTGPET